MSDVRATIPTAAEVAAIRERVRDIGVVVEDADLVLCLCDDVDALRADNERLRAEHTAVYSLVSRLWQLVTLRTVQYRSRCNGTIRDTKLDTEIVAALNAVDDAETTLREFGYTGPDWTPAALTR